MSDQIYVTDDAGDPPLNVETATVAGSTVSIVIENPQGNGSIGTFQYELQAIFDQGDDFEIVDATTGQTYRFDPTAVEMVGGPDQPGAFGETVVASFAPDSTPFSGTLTGTAPPACFVQGTGIATPAGEVPVETLEPGDVVTLATGGTGTVRWIGHRSASDAAVVRLRPHALGENRPRRDLWLSDDHALFVDGALVPAALLVDGVAIAARRLDRVVFFHVELEAHGILLAEGAPAESYLDTGNRRRFGNCPIGYDAVAADGAACAELVVAGERLARIRARLAPVPA